MAAAALAVAVTWSVYAADTPKMSFFVTSTGSGNGGDLGGLAGADALCQRLADEAGAGDRQWAAYLSTQGPGAVDARTRIGNGPWYNAKGVLIAPTVADLLRDDVNINHETALDERGNPVPGVAVDANGNPLSQQPPGNQHDILTGTQANGTAFRGPEDRTCRNWTSSSEGSAMLGHSDRRSLQPGLSPWAEAHASRGCSQEQLVSTGGAGRLYCFVK
jgi:hypothetical protein